MSTNDYRVTVKVRNNRILKAIEEVGGEPGAKWCVENELSYGLVNDLINMTSSPVRRDGALTSTASKLCEALDKLPEDLWSNTQLYPLEKNFTELEMNEEQVMGLLHGPEPSPEELTNELEKNEIVQKVLSTLTYREQEVIDLRYKEELTLEEIANSLEVSRERVRQIENKALRKLRRNTRGRELVELLNDENLKEQTKKEYKWE